MAYYQSNYPQNFGYSNNGSGYNPYGGYSGYPPQNNFGGGGGFGHSAYNVNQYQQPMPQEQFLPGFMPAQMMNMIRAPPPIRQMPVSHQTNVVNMNMWSAENASMMCAQMLGLITQADIDEEPEDDDEEEDDFDEEEVEESRSSRKSIKKKIKKKVKATEKINEKVKEDPGVLEQYRDMYAEELQKRFKLYGTLEPTEGTIKPLVSYSKEDPVFLYTLETEEFELENWDPEYDCIYLKNAMDGAGTNEEAIINVIVSRSNDQRQELKKQYKTSYGLDLIEELQSELSGDFKETVMAMFVKPAVFDAWCIQEAIYGLGTDESVLIEILTTRTNAQIHELREAYPDVASPNRKTSENLIEQDIEDDTSGDFKQFLISASQGNRRELNPDKIKDAVEFPTDEDGNPKFPVFVNEAKLANNAKAQRDAKKLYESGEGQLGTNEEEFIRIFANNEVYQLRATYTEYVKLCQRDILNSIDRETSGNFYVGLHALIQNIRCRPMYFAQRLVWCMKGLGTEDRDLIRLIVSRSEIDLVQIKSCFLQLTNKTLWKWIQEDTSGDYRHLLCAIVGKN